MLTEDELKTISERMGEAVHSAWMEQRKRDKSWHSPEECPSIAKRKGIPPSDGKYCMECHPCMRPYKDLLDSDKELDMSYPKLFFKILDDMGYIVVSKNLKIRSLS